MWLIKPVTAILKFIFDTEITTVNKRSITELNECLLLVSVLDLSTRSAYAD